MERIKERLQSLVGVFIILTITGALVGLLLLLELPWGTPQIGESTDGGNNQSPIDLNTTIAKRDSNLGFLNFSWKKLENVSLTWSESFQLYSTKGISQVHPSWMTHPDLLKEPFLLEEFHLHHPSEHTIDGIHFSAEVQFVHRSKEQDQIAVIAVLFEQGTEDDWSDFFQLLLNEKPSEKDQDPVTVRQIAPTLVLAEIHSLSYFYYIGSTTTSPYNKGVNWFVMQEPVMIHPEQLARLQQYQKPNNRPIQPSNKRSVSSWFAGPETFCSTVGSDCAACQDACNGVCLGTCKEYDNTCQARCYSQCVLRLCCEAC